MLSGELLHACAHAISLARTQASTRTHAHTHECMYEIKRTHTYKPSHVRMHICTSAVCMHACTYVCTYVVCMHLCRFMIISTLTVGYGDMSPSTHYGRVCASAIITVGVMLGAVSTASLTHLLSWSPDELMTLKILERAKERNQLRKLASQKLALRMKQFLLKHRKAKRTSKDQSSLQSNPQDGLSLAQRVRLYFDLHVAEFLADPLQHAFGHRPASESHELTAKLRALQVRLHKNVGGLNSDSHKVDKIYVRMKHVLSAISEVQSKVNDCESMQLVANKLSRQISGEDHAADVHQDDISADMSNMSNGLVFSPFVRSLLFRPNSIKRAGSSLTLGKAFIQISAKIHSIA
jgi:hypothetical protein